MEEACGRNRLMDVPQNLDAKQIKAIKRHHLKDKWPMRQIARHMGISCKTVKKHLSPSRPPCPSPQRASKLDSFKQPVAELLQRDFTVKSAAILRHLRSLGYQGGRTILRDYLRRIRTKSGPSIPGSRQEVFDWMRAVLQGALGQAELASELSHVAELDKLLAAIIEGRLSNRNKAMAVLARQRGIGQSYVCSSLDEDCYEVLE
jgi:AraC-like DNA-binding protein